MIPIRYRILFLGGALLAFAAFVAPGMARPSSTAATGCKSEPGTHTAVTPSYRMVLRIGMPEKMYTLAQVSKMHPKSGEVMVGGSMMGTGGMSMGGAMRHVEVQICSRSRNAVLANANPTIVIVDTSARMTMKMTVAMMRGVDAGMEDMHYGNNVAMSAGHAFVVKVSLKGERAVFHVRMPKHM